MKTLKNEAKGSQRGSILIELVVGVAVAGMLAGGFGTTMMQMFRHTAMGNDHSQALMEIMNAGRLITPDIQQAETTSLVDGAAPVSTLTLTWADWSNSELTHTVTYSQAGSLLLRNQDGSISTMARTVSTVEFSLNGGVVSVRVASSPSTQSGLVEQRTYQIALRVQ